MEHAGAAARAPAPSSYPARPFPLGGWPQTPLGAKGVAEGNAGSGPWGALDRSEKIAA